ncbi:MAG: hypothetical protein GEU82_01945 [Luteitalea sp.]|nr:hypothetical protein [Luteitalea sp.]
MIRINLLAIERKAAKKPVTFGTGPKLTVAAALILLSAAGFVGWRYMAIDAESKRLDADIAAADQEVLRLRSVLAQVAQFEQQKALLQQRVNLIEQLRSDQTGPVHMLDQISRALPSMMWLTDLKQTPVANEVVIAGRCTTLTGLSDFVGNLEASGYFKRSVEIISSVTEPLTTPPFELVSFEIKAVFQQPGGAGRAAEAAAAKPGN